MPDPLCPRDLGRIVREEPKLRTFLLLDFTAWSRRRPGFLPGKRWWRTPAAWAYEAAIKGDIDVVAVAYRRE